MSGEPTAPEERLRQAEALLSEILRLARHLETQHGQTFLTVSHENRIRKFLCLLPRVPTTPTKG